MATVTQATSVWIPPELHFHFLKFFVLFTVGDEEKKKKWTLNNVKVSKREMSYLSLVCHSFKPPYLPAEAPAD